MLAEFDQTFAVSMENSKNIYQIQPANLSFHMKGFYKSRFECIYLKYQKRDSYYNKSADREIVHWCLCLSIKNKDETCKMLYDCQCQ